MQYIGRHPQEGLVRVEENNPSGASVIKNTNTFISKGDDTSSGGFGQSGMYHDMYQVEVVSMSSSGDDDAMRHKWIDNSGTDEDGTYYRSQFYNSPTTASSGTTTNNSNASSVYGHNFGSGIGHAGEDSANGQAWWTPFGYQKELNTDLFLVTMVVMVVMEIFLMLTSQLFCKIQVLHMDMKLLWPQVLI